MIDLDGIRWRTDAGYHGVPSDVAQGIKADARALLAEVERLKAALEGAERNGESWLRECERRGRELAALDMEAHKLRADLAAVREALAGEREEVDRSHGLVFFLRSLLAIDAVRGQLRDNELKALTEALDRTDRRAAESKAAKEQS